MQGSEQYLKNAKIGGSKLTLRNNDHFKTEVGCPFRFTIHSSSPSVSWEATCVNHIKWFPCPPAFSIVHPAEKEALEKKQKQEDWIQSFCFPTFILWVLKTVTCPVTEGHISCEAQQQPLCLQVPATPFFVCTTFLRVVTLTDIKPRRLSCPPHLLCSKVCQ